MASRFNDDLFQPPNWAQDGAIPRRLDPLHDFDPVLPDWFPPAYPWWVNPSKAAPNSQPSQPTPGYPWWVDPYVLPTLQPHAPPADFPPRSTLQAPASAINPPQEASPNWLLSYYHRMLAQQGLPQPVQGFDRAEQDEAQPERRLGQIIQRA